MNNAPSQPCTIPMLFMVIERYKDPKAVYARFHEKGRMLPEGLEYLASWVDMKLANCFQLMKTDDIRLIDKWTSKWDDIVEFEVHQVMSSEQARIVMEQTQKWREWRWNLNLQSNAPFAGSRKKRSCRPIIALSDTPAPNAVKNSSPKPAIAAFSARTGRRNARRCRNRP